MHALRAQTYYKLSYVDRRVDNPEHRICEDIPALCDGLADLLGEWCKCARAACFGILRATPCSVLPTCWASGASARAARGLFRQPFHARPPSLAMSQ
jgi:hypothetical protein